MRDLVRKAVLYSVLYLASLSVVEAVESSYKVACYSSYALKRYVGEVVVYVNIFTVKVYIH